MGRNRANALSALFVVKSKGEITMGQSAPTTKAEILNEIEKLDKRMISLTNSIASRQDSIARLRASAVKSQDIKNRIGWCKSDIAKYRAEISNCRTKKATLKARLKKAEI